MQGFDTATCNTRRKEGYQDTFTLGISPILGLEEPRINRSHCRAHVCLRQQNGLGNQNIMCDRRLKLGVLHCQHTPATSCKLGTYFTKNNNQPAESSLYCHAFLYGAHPQPRHTHGARARLDGPRDISRWHLLKHDTSTEAVQKVNQ